MCSYSQEEQLLKRRGKKPCTSSFPLPLAYRQTLLIHFPFHTHKQALRQTLVRKSYKTYSILCNCPPRHFLLPECQVALLPFQCSLQGLLISVALDSRQHHSSGVVRRADPSTCSAAACVKLHRLAQPHQLHQKYVASTAEEQRHLVLWQRQAFVHHGSNDCTCTKTLHFGAAAARPAKLLWPQNFNMDLYSLCV